MRQAPRVKPICPLPSARDPTQPQSLERELAASLGDQLITVDLPTGRALFWLGGDLPAGYSSDHRESSSVRADGPPVEASVAVEWTAPRGPRSLYGLLGGTARSTDRRELTLITQFSDGQGSRYRSMGHDFEFDELRVGLPAEYRGGINEGVAWIRRSLAPESVPRAILTIDHAAHGALGSCDVMFAALIVTLIRLLGCVARTGTVEPKELSELLDRPPDKLLAPGTTERWV